MALWVANGIFDQIQDYGEVDKDTVYEFVDILESYASKSDTNCEGGDQFGLGTLCDSFDGARTKTALVHEVLGLCDFETDVASINTFCTRSDTSGLPATVFDALSDESHLITFSGGGSLEMAFEIGQTRGTEAAISYTADASDTLHLCPLAAGLDAQFFPLPRGHTARMHPCPRPAGRMRDLRSVVANAACRCAA